MHQKLPDSVAAVDSTREGLRSFIKLLSATPMEVAEDKALVEEAIYKMEKANALLCRVEKNLKSEAVA